MQTTLAFLPRLPNRRAVEGSILWSLSYLSYIFFTKQRDYRAFILIIQIATNTEFRKPVAPNGYTEQLALPIKNYAPPSRGAHE